MPLSFVRRTIALLGLVASLASHLSATRMEVSPAVDEDILRRVQGLRTPTEISVSTTKELVAALADASIDAIVVQDGSYNLTATLKVTRSVSIRAAETGKAILNGQGRVQVLSIQTSGTVHMAGMQVMGGKQALNVGIHVVEPFPERSPIAPLREVSWN